MREFLARAGWQDATLVPLAGDASTRRYMHATRGDRKAMLMDQPQGAESPACPPNAKEEERRALGYNAIARLAGADCARFVATAEYLRTRGFSAPEIYAADAAQGFVLMEDLGNNLYADIMNAGGDEAALYSAAIDALALLHTEQAPDILAPDKPLYDYDETALLAEIDLLTEWFLPMALQRPAQEAEILEHRALWRDALCPVLAAPRVFVHRDYHAQNILWLPDREGSRRVGIIDFQDAVGGSRSYDLVSLLEDARRDVNPDLAEAMTRNYFAAMRTRGQPLDEGQHRAEMAVLAAQRNAKIVGIFSRLFKRDNKPRYLAYMPRVWNYLNRDLSHPAMAPLKKWYDRTVPQAYRGELRVEGATS